MGPVSPSPTADPCATAVPDLPNDLPTAFAYELEPPAILRFVSALARVPQREQRRVFNAAVDAASSPTEHAVQMAIAQECSNLDEIYGTSRTLYLVVNEWKLGELSDAKRFGDFSAAVGTAISALSLGDRLTPQNHDAALLPFADLPGLATPTPAPSPSGSGLCSQPDTPARTTHVVPVDYPPFAGTAGTAGTVYVKLSLNEVGELRSARIFSNTLQRGLGSDQLIRAAIFAAAASTYAPAIKNCLPVGGIYVFKVGFSVR